MKTFISLVLSLFLVTSLFADTFGRSGSDSNAITASSESSKLFCNPTTKNLIVISTLNNESKIIIVKVKGRFNVNRKYSVNLLFVDIDGPAKFVSVNNVNYKLPTNVYDTIGCGYVTEIPTSGH